MFEFGFYEKEITPPLGCHIPGYFNMRRGADVQDRLYARAVVVRSGETAVAIISVDGCGPEAVIVEPIAKRIEEYTGIKRDCVLVGFTHSHTAIPRSVYNGGSGDIENMKKCEEDYHTLLIKLVADCATLAYLRLKKAVPVFGQGDVDGISFCRNYHMKNATPQTNPPRKSENIIGPVSGTDNDLPVLFVKDEKDNPLGAILGFACHPDCVSGDKLTGDYISELSKELKKTYGNDFVTVYLLGCCGDINHIDVSCEKDIDGLYRLMGQKIAGEAQKVVAFANPLSLDGIKTCMEYLDIPRREISEEQIEDARHCIDTVKEIEGIMIAADSSHPDQYRLMMAKSLMRFVENTPEIIRVPLQTIQIGEFTIYAFPSEIYHHFGELVKQGDGTGKCLVATLCSQGFGYVPTRDVFYDTIYEARPGANTLSKEAGYIMADKLVSMKK